MKNKIQFFVATILLFTNHLFAAGVRQSSSQVVERVLEIPSYRDFLTEAKTEMDSLLKEKNIVNPEDRKILSDASFAVSEMLDRGTGYNAGKLVDLLIWIKSRKAEIANIKETGTNQLSEIQQVYLDSKLFSGGLRTSLTTPLRGILNAYLECDREDCPPELLEATLQLYLNLRQVLEEDGNALPYKLLFYAPRWTQTRFFQLTEDQKKLFLEELEGWCKAKALGPGPDEDPTQAIPFSAEEKAAYEAAYRVIMQHAHEPSRSPSALQKSNLSTQSVKENSLTNIQSLGTSSSKHKTSVSPIELAKSDPCFHKTWLWISLGTILFAALIWVLLKKLRN